MPKECSTCHNVRTKKEFTPSQWKKDDRTCRECAPPPDQVQASRRAIQADTAGRLLEEALESILRLKVEMDIQEQDIVVDDEGFVKVRLTNLMALVGKTLRGEYHVDAKVGYLSPSGDDILPRHEYKTLLMWMSQPKLLQFQLDNWNQTLPPPHERGFSAEATQEAIKNLIEAGADVNFQQHNAATAMFFAVKYCDVSVVDMLLAAGCDSTHLNILGSPAIAEAIHVCDPAIVRVLLKDWPADTPIMTCGGGDRRITIAENMIGLASSPAAWKIMGPPTVTNYVETFAELLLAGSRICHDNGSLNIAVFLYFASKIHPDGSARKECSDTDLHVLGRLRESYSLIHNTACANVIVGQYMPKVYRKRIKCFRGWGARMDAGGHEPGECPICLEECAAQHTALYCGHAFCLDCIRTHGSGGETQSCPICRKPLAIDLLPTIPSQQQPRFESPLGINMHTLINVEPGALLQSKSHKELSTEQLKHEMAAQRVTRGKDDAALPEEAPRGVLVQHLQKELDIAESQMKSCPRAPQVEPGSSVSVTFGPAGDDQLTIISPKLGMVRVWVTVKSVPVLAVVSLTSFFTIMSRSFAENFEVPVSDLSSSFLDNIPNGPLGGGHGKKSKSAPKKCFLAKAFELSLGGIPIQLNNSAVVYDDMQVGIGLQIGLDVFCQAAWCSIDLIVGTIANVQGADEESGSGLRILAHRGGEYFIGLSDALKQSNEQLRYYSFGGQIAVLPLVHMDKYSPENTGYLPSLYFDSTANVHTCSWCYRIFPKLKECLGCRAVGIKTYYCGPECQKAAWPAHKLRGFCKRKKKKKKGK